ncbi:molybdate transport repressor ModE-like protein [Oxalobacteraceae bacterium GrIS 2.11]
MYKVDITPLWKISSNAAPGLDMSALLALLSAIQKTGSIAQAAQQVGLSYRYAWGLLRAAEQMFNDALMSKTRGQGTTLTPLAEKLIWAERRVAARLAPTLESLSSELEAELNKNLPDKSPVIRLHASHGFAVAALMKIFNHEQFPIETQYRNSTDAVAALSRKECELAGFHVPLGEFESAAVARYTRWLNPKTHCLIHLAVRNQGLFVAAGNPKNISGVNDLDKNQLVFVNRQTGSGTRLLLEMLLAKHQVDSRNVIGFDTTELTHSAVAAFIASGMADVGFGVQTAAQRFGLDFIPLVREQYFFALPLAALNDPTMQHVIEVMQSEGYRNQVNQLAGYDASDTGKIISINQAFQEL